MNRKCGTPKSNRLSDLSFAIVGVARNCEKSIRQDVHRLSGAFQGAKSVLWFVVESDSDDGTVSELEALRSEIRGFEFASLGRLREQIPGRTERISHCRNQYVQRLRSHEAYKGVDYVVVADLDGLNSLISSEAVESCWGRDDWDVCAANQSAPYYDIWALRHPAWCPGDCWAEYRFLNGFRADREANLSACVHSRMITIPSDAPWIEVESAFGGLAIYRREFFCLGDYVGVREGHEAFCEHVHFHGMLRANGARIYINPGLINSGYNEHTAELLLRNRVRRRVVNVARRVLGN